jgi:hypothetical protein
MKDYCDHWGDSEKKTIDWGDGTRNTGPQNSFIKHLYAFNGTYKIELNCGDELGWVRYVTRVNVSTTKDPLPSTLSTSVGALPRIAALIASIVAVLTYLAGRKQGRKEGSDARPNGGNV